MERLLIVCGQLSVLLCLPAWTGVAASTVGHESLAWMGDFNPNRSAFFQDNDLQMDGWLNIGLTFNPRLSANEFNDTVTFSDRANEPQLNQFYWFLQREIPRDAEHWQWGGRLDFILGSDAFFTRSMGDPGNHWDAHIMHDPVYGVAFPQAYLEINAPLGSGLRMRLGEFYTLIGSESVMTAPDNFFYSHAYLMQYAEPFSHTGYLFDYRCNDYLELTAGAVTGSPYAGWDGSFEHRLENWGVLASMVLSWPQSASSLTIAGIHGEASLHPGQAVNLYSMTLKHDLTKQWHLIIEHDYGWNTTKANAVGSEWYGIAGYLKYDLHTNMQLGMRLEWFRDDDGVRVGVPARHPAYLGPASNYFEATVGANWQPTDWLTFRPSVRYDYSDGWQAFANTSNNDQFLVMSDVIIHF